MMTICPECRGSLGASAIRGTSCPHCGARIERRESPSTPDVRAWITKLRLTGGDFDKEAARAAGEVAYHVRQAGGREEDGFQAARLAYYETMREEANA